MATSDYPGDIPLLKRRQAAPTSQGAIPPGIALTPEQIQANKDAEWRRGSLQRQADFKQGVSEVAGSVGSKVKDAYGAVLGAATIIPRTGYGIATGEIPVNVQHLPDYSAGKAPSTPDPRNQAGGIMAFDIAQRAVDSAQRPFGIPRSMPTQAAPAESGIVKTSSAAKKEQPETPGVAGSAQSSGAGGPAAIPSTSNGWSKTGIGVGRHGGEIVGRMGANGVPEFTNKADAGEGFGLQRAIGRVGDGIGGGLTVGEAGDSQIAIGRFERANAERAASLGGIGGGRFVQAGNAMPDAMDRAAQRREASIAAAPASSRAQRNAQEIAMRGLEMQQRSDISRAELGLRAEETAQQGIDAGLDRGLKERELAGTEQRNQLESQKTQQEIEQGSLSLQQQQRQVELLSKIQDPATSDADRQRLTAQYRSLYGKGEEMTPRDYIVKRKVPVLDEKGYPVSEKEELVDGRTGLVLGAQGGNQPASNVAAGHGGFPEPTSRAEYDALPKGAQYMKDGQIRIKS